MNKVITIGVDLAKNVFQVHGAMTSHRGNVNGLEAGHLKANPYEPACGN